MAAAGNIRFSDVEIFIPGAVSAMSCGKFLSQFFLKNHCNCNDIGRKNIFCLFGYELIILIHRDM